MSEGTETNPSFPNEGERQLTVLRSLLTGITNKGLNPQAVIEIDACISQANFEIRQEDAISADTIKQMNELIEKYKNEKF